MKLAIPIPKLTLLIVFSLLISLSARAAISGKDLFSKGVVEVVPGAKGTVVVFMSVKCPCSASHVEIIRKLATEFKEFTFTVVHSNRDEDEKITRLFFGRVAFPFTVLQDHNNRLADELKANKTPHAFLINPQGEILYKGGVTNSTVGETADKNFLRDALSDVLANRLVKVPEGRTLGCSISRAKSHGW